MSNTRELEHQGVAKGHEFGDDAAGATHAMSVPDGASCAQLHGT